MQSSFRMPDCEILRNSNSTEKPQGRSPPKKCASNVKIFKGLILYGPYYIFVTCNCSLYHRSVAMFPNEWCPFSNFRHLAFVKYFNDKCYVCKTSDVMSDSKMIKINSPIKLSQTNFKFLNCQLVFKMLGSLGKFLLRVLLFKKLTIMLGQFPKVIVMTRMAS